jgi:Leucine-rich repeat (LRR) protein
MNPGVCFFTFFNTITVLIKCTADVSNSSTIPFQLLSSTYFSNIATVEFASPISSLPLYLCSLPSHIINLSYQSFTTLSDATFPCLDWFHTVILSYNQLTSVDVASGNFTNLTILDLSSNQLTTIPYSVLNPTPSSLRYLNLSNNSITSIDLWLYTRKNVTVNLSDNPISSSSIINPQNITLPSENNTNLTISIILPSSVTNSTYIIDDQTALTAGTCTSNTVLAYLSILRSIYINVLLNCTCASINLQEIFSRSGLSITNSINCSNGTTAANFNTLTMASCGSAALNIATGLCYNASLQVCSIFLKNLS